MSVTENLHPRPYPDPAAALQLIKPITWFPPMWAFVCGAISSGVSPDGQWGLLMLGVLLAGPIVCGMSQAANDWCDRHVDAINEPDRPIPSGRVPGRWGLWIALAMSALALARGCAARALGLRRHRGRGDLRLGLFRRTGPAEALRLARAGPRRALLRGAALVHRRGGAGRGRAAVADRR